MKRRIELLAPGGDVDCIKAAIVAGADAVYCGLDKFNARHRAANVSLDDIHGILALAHRQNCRVYVTLNVVMVESDIPVLVGLLNRLVNTDIDGVIVQDLGLLHLLSKNYRGLNVHASTQLTTHNEGQIRFLKKLNVARVNLSRELNIDEVGSLTRFGHEENVLIEVFVHGSYCLSFSGICYFSSINGHNSGNRGRCSQPCRDRYLATPEGKSYPLNLKDNSAYFDVRALDEAGVDAIKIEGRMKGFHYVYTVTNTWSRQLQGLYDQDRLVNDDSDLHKVFNRGFSNSYLTGEVNRNMFVDDPRNNAAEHLRHVDGRPADDDTDRETAPFDEIASIRADVRGRIEELSIAKAPLAVSISGKLGAPLRVTVNTPDASFVVSSESCLASRSSGNPAQLLSPAMFHERFKAIKETGYFIERLDLEGLQRDLFVPRKDLTAIKNRVLYVLNGSRDLVAPVDVPVFSERPGAQTRSTLSVLVSSEEDLHLCDETPADVFLQLPSCLKNRYHEFADLFARTERTTPWFPPVLIGDDYAAAVELLRQVRPARIVTNNTGIALEAYKNGVPWIAGPYLNVANTLTLLGLKETFNCSGAFLSNELSQYQMKRIRAPEDFELYYSIFHPVMLLKSRQCLFHQVIGCEKDRVDDTCLAQCERSSSITNHKKGDTFFINKTKGNYSSIYYEKMFLNTDIVSDMPSLFYSYSIDLRDIRTSTKTELDRPKIVSLFARHLSGDNESTRQLVQGIYPTTDTLYRRGI